MTTISVIIPSHNRSTLLQEAIASVNSQTYKDWEVVIVDDASQPPVDELALRKDFGPNIRVIRNDEPMKLAYARDQGVQAAKGEVVIQLDDDDLLAPQALQMGLIALESDPTLELVFLGVEGFGARSEYFNEAQGRAIKRVLKQAKGSEFRPELIRFGSDLFGALLHTVPMAFQRSIMYRSVWDKVSSLRKRVYMLDQDIHNEEQAMRRIRPPLRDSEWALYSAVSCRTALLTAPTYLQRCDGQGYVSQPSQRELSMLSSIDIKLHLYGASKEYDIFKPWAKEIKNGLARTYFDHSYIYFQDGKRSAAYRELIKALKARPTAAYLCACYFHSIVLQGSYR